MKNYFDLIKNALIEADEADSNWAWYPVKYSDNAVEFRWGYFDYLEDEKNFVIFKHGVNKNETMIEVKIPSGYCVLVLVGEECWDDVRNIEDGIKRAIKRATTYAKHIY